MTHPFHPLKGREFALITYRHNWGEDRVYFHDDDGELTALPASWTSVAPQDPFREIAAGRCVLRFVDLMELLALARQITARSERTSPEYEMLRRVQVDGLSVVEAAKRFGFSRAGFYKTLSAFQRLGLVGLIPARPGPRRAHKLTSDILAFIDEQMAVRGSLPAAELAALILEQRAVCVHPRSIERALARREKRGW